MGAEGPDRAVFNTCANVNAGSCPGVVAAHPKRRLIPTRFRNR